MLMKDCNGAVDQKKGHHGIDRFGVPGKEFAERGAKHCPYKQPEAPIRESMTANPAKDSVVWYTGNMYRDIAVIA